MKSRLDNNGIVLTQNQEGYVEPNKFTFNPPASLSQIKRFKEETGLILPADFQSFLLLHNGAQLFVHPYYGGGVDLLSLDQMLDYRFDYLQCSHRLRHGSVINKL
nr:SMI1/KNR4 family protein [Brevibacillus agri]